MSAATFRLEATLRGIRPPIWRRLRVPCTLTLGQLHQLLQIVLGWTNSHLHQFRVGNECFGVRDPGDPWGADVTDERRGPEHFDVDFVNRQLRSIRLPRQVLPRRATPTRTSRSRKRD